MPKNREKLLYGAAGVVGSSILAWRTLFPWIVYDIQLLKTAVKFGKHMVTNLMSGKYLIDMFEDDVQKSPTKPFIVFEDKVYTYEVMDQQANRVASIASQWKLKVGETVAIMITNEPAFIWTFLGLQKLGIAVAFINFNIRMKPLVQSIRACDSKVLIIGQEDDLLQAAEEVRSELEDIPIFVQGTSLLQSQSYTRFDELMQQAVPAGVCKAVRAGVHPLMPSCYILTSGTTGLPKPCIITQAKAIGFSAFLLFVKCSDKDIVYTPLPLYHSAAGGIGLMGAIGTGATMVLRGKFSARHFWEDCRKYNVTIAQYIGELCRYLLAVPESAEDGKHCIRVMVGNGLRQDIWEKFQTRFKVPKICEFFGATEGTTSIINVSNRVGSCGRVSPFINLFDPVKKYIVKFDYTESEPVRDKYGHCIAVRPGETGLLLTTIPPEVFEIGFYKGSKDINEKKIIRNVFKDGDAFFSYGDLIMIDSNYFAYFKDRLGDTFRWKGENVSTYEVADVMTGLNFIHDANVYGVEIPGADGRAGMAAVHLIDGTPVSNDVLKMIFNHCMKNLPIYAQPVFLRFPKDQALTLTFKQVKVELVNEGYNPNIIKDPLFFRDDVNHTYSPLTKEKYSQLITKSKL
ncbi:hypothetical protein CHS0354_040225 [Potamilus streckersoni]|uniref:Long-chain-fatty-acid--CoA ligase n=1 Tax=Potamilus streckersoni TaxID=2493646 RepID=A0AAE0S4Q0_9BIVA|nr:hypothetical protein CHS0354_040225 [Potamilus streckersoni]